MRILAWVLMFFAAALAAEYSAGDLAIGDGERAFHRFIAPVANQNAADFAKQKTAAEWEGDFAKGGEKFLSDLARKYPSLKALTQRKTFQSNLPALEKFMKKFAKDGEGYTPPKEARLAAHADRLAKEAKEANISETNNSK
ncbi:MAG: hypothetical protein LBU73_05820 [Helicobacteraceae bacterium]|jgi:hypothetical protein|nr:hypothetical protein [Helicobacteraceae bacterium]